MTKSAQQVIDQSPMRPAQFIIVLLGGVLFALDGFDVMAISFAAPGIANEWGIDRAALGVVLAMELIGMSFGSILVGSLADSFGRRTAILGCLWLMGLGMGLTALADDVFSISAYRLATGIGIGGLLPAVTAIVSEFASERRRAMAISFASSGFTLGAVIGGLAVTQLLQVYSWRSVFVFGSACTLVAIPLVYVFLPESISYLVERRPKDALQRINRILQRLKMNTIDRLADAEIVDRVADQGRKTFAWLHLFQGELTRSTVCLTLAYLGHMLTFYFFVKWTPKIVVDLGYPAAEAGGVLIWANVGGFFGAMLFGVLASRFRVKVLTLSMLALSVVSVSAFGNSNDELRTLSTIACVVGLFTTASISGFYTLMAHCFPTEVRASGTGFVIGTGRSGAALSPIIAGLLFAAGSGLSTVTLLMAGGSLIAIVAILLLRQKQA